MFWKGHYKNVCAKERPVEDKDEWSQMLSQAHDQMSTCRNLLQYQTQKGTMRGQKIAITALQWSYQSQNIPELNTRVEERKTDIRDITTDPSAFSHSSALRGAETQEWHGVDIMSLREGDKLFSRNGQHRKLERSSGNFFWERKAYCFVVSISLFPILPEKRKS